MNIPEGCVLVPIDPTEQMLIAGADQDWTEDVYTAMISSRPSSYPSDSIEGCYEHALKAMEAENDRLRSLMTYDEAKERELFAAEFKLEGKIYFDENTRQWMPVSESIKCFQMAEQTLWCWIGWKDCAKSRARSAE